VKLISEKYRSLKPTIEYLIDPVVIAQAWKKTHGYIRSFNWYADTLALDISALGIEELSKKWGTQLENKEKLHLIELVPAAKSENWIIDKVKGWSPVTKPKDRKESPPLRPLAHITIRDQTWASTAMLCLADAIETEQGNCGEKNFWIAQSKNVYSYGNRLVCDWEHDKAWFRWGNSDTYRKFFTDYQNFIKRPLTIGREIAESSRDPENVYIVNFDLSKFYNNIDTGTLIKRLQRISNKFGYVECPKFWSAVQRITKWEWDEKTIQAFSTLKIENATKGLPQGLVASGFFANAYLAEFDKKVGAQIRTTISDECDITLHDYCRYVDDIRLVIYSESSDLAEISEKLNNWLSKILTSHGGKNLRVNPEKTKVIKLADLANHGSMSSRIEMIQEDLSGPADRDTLENASGLLENLLSIDGDSNYDLVELRKTKINRNDLKLVSITQFDHDIRPDTLKRFAANRLESIMRSKRKIDFDQPDDISSKFFKDSDNESELLAKKLISAWMKDPSLGLVLRKAIEIYPNADLFSPIFEAIYSRSSFGNRPNKITAAFMDFLLADLFRCASDFHGYFQGVTYPSSADPSGILEVISNYAQKVVSARKNLKFVERQALMVLAVLNKPVLIEFEDQSIQKILHSILAGSPPKLRIETIALFEVASQITGKIDSYAVQYLACLKKDGIDKDGYLIPFAKRGGPFWNSLWKIISRDNELASVKKELKWAATLEISKLQGSSLRLSNVISSDTNGFEHEAALLKLALSLAELAEIKPGVIESSPAKIFVRKKGALGWDALWHPETSIQECSVDEKDKAIDPRFKIPPWVMGPDGELDSDRAVIYWIGAIMRSSVLGRLDFTGNRWKTGKTVTYKGLRASWYKRRMGMMHAPEAVLGEFATVTSWFSELLMSSLQWPGFQSTYVANEDIKAIEDLKTFKQCIRNRLDKLNAIYCQASNVPLLPTTIGRPSKENQLFRLITVQPLLPRTEDFSIADPCLNNINIRAKHRDHLLAMCQLTFKTLQTKSSADKGKQQHLADLIVFPEVAVHIDDLDVLKRLADKTRAIIFAGVVFTDHKGKLVNFARWIIPDIRPSGRQWIIRDQGKEYMTPGEVDLGITGYRPCQHLIEIHGHPEGPFRLSGAICYDATDIRLAADLRDKTDLFVVAAHNADVSTFDNMAAALHFHMFQHIVITNIGEFGGTTIQAPFKLPYHRLISHVHGSDQIAINMADLDLAAFKRKVKTYKEVKSKPAGL
jgi:hypothetical protein